MIVLIIVGIVFLLDQISKAAVRKYIPEKTRREIIKDRFYITNVRNTGAAYGAFAHNRKLLLALTYAAFGSLFLLFGNVFKKGTADKVSFALILGGALGNFYDRLKKKYVTDFVYIKFKKAPIFNIADFAIFAGTILMIIRSFRKEN